MNILGIETSCDETAAAVVQDGRKLLSNIIASQIDLHAQYGGVVPEVAARSHIEVMLPVVTEALDVARLSWNDIDGIAVTAGPGLLGSLLIGTLTARTLAEIKCKPLYALNHVEAHVYANFIDVSSIKNQESSNTAHDTKFKIPDSTHQTPKFPMLALIVSGGHSQFVLFQAHLDYQVLGQTLDDAAGEAFDKVAKLLNLGFPGGPAIAKAALQGSSLQYKFPKAKLGKDSLDYSFSGLKTAVLRQVQSLVKVDHKTPSWELHHKLSNQQKNDLAASFQKAVVDTLIDRFVYAYEKYKPKSIVLAGGVAANLALRQSLTERLPIEVHIPPISLCTDNAAMIAALGYHYAQANKKIDPQLLQTDSSLAM